MTGARITHLRDAGAARGGQPGRQFESEAVSVLSTARQGGAQRLAETREERVLDLIYAAALDPALWPTAMAGVADMVEGTQACLTRLDVLDGTGEAIISRSDPTSIDQYMEHFKTKNIFVVTENPSAFIRGWTPVVLTEADCVPWETYQSSEYCNDFMRPHDLNAALFIRLELSETKVAKMNVGKPLRGGRFERRHVETAARLQPHLLRAYRFGRSLAVSLGPDRDLAQAVEGSAHPVYLVDETGAIKLVNRSGERLLGADKGLTVLNGRLVARHSEAARRLELLVAAATAADGPQVGGSMSLPQPGRRFPLAVRITPIPRIQMAMFSRPRTALVCVTDLETAVRSPEAELRALFGLTYAEARVATAIFEGLSMREAADQLGVALNTVRFQLARVYEKTGVTRQAELVKMMMRLSGSLGEG